MPVPSGVHVAFGRETTEYILHIGILTNHQDCLLVAEAHHKPDYKCTTHHSGGIVACSRLLVAEPFVVLLPDFGPRQRIGLFYPPVAIIQYLNRVLMSVEEFRLLL